MGANANTINTANGVNFKTDDALRLVTIARTYLEKRPLGLIRRVKIRTA
jgi:hypothetical protein